MNKNIGKVFLYFTLISSMLCLSSCYNEVNYKDYDHDIIYSTTVGISSFLTIEVIKEILNR